MFLAAAHAIEHLVPFGQIRLRQIQLQLAADHLGEIALLQHNRRFIERLHREIFNDTVWLDIAKQSNLTFEIIVYRAIHAHDDDVWCNTGGLEFFDGVLGGLGFMLIRTGEIWHKRHMDVKAVAWANFVTHLTDRLQKRLALNVANRTADLGDHHIRVRRIGNAVDKPFDLVGYMRNDLHRFAKVGTRALVGQNIPVDLSRGEVGESIQILVDKAFIVTQVQVGLGAVFGYEHLAVLKRAHRTRINVDIRVQLLRGNLQAACFEQATKRCRRNALAQTRNNTARHKNILRHTISSVSLPFLLIVFSKTKSSPKSG